MPHGDDTMRAEDLSVMVLGDLSPYDPESLRPGISERAPAPRR
jgi:hypothetical protein